MMIVCVSNVYGVWLIIVWLIIAWDTLNKMIINQNNIERRISFHGTNSGTDLTYSANPGFVLFSVRSSSLDPLTFVSKYVINTGE